MSKTTARLVLALHFTIYLLAVFVPVTAVLDLLRWWALPPGATFVEIVWTGIVDPLSILIITMLNCILTWTWATRVKKFTRQRILVGPRQRALEALKTSKD